MIQILWSIFSKRKEKQIVEEIGSKPETISIEPKTEAYTFEPKLATVDIRSLWRRRAQQVGETQIEEVSRIERGLIVSRVQ
jgi:hypothetical protein